MSKYPGVVKVVSGGQSGADQAGLRAAELLELGTGGFMPQGFATEDGPRPDLGKRFGLAALPGRGHMPRTRANIKSSDGTVVFGKTSSAGSKRTIEECIRLGKPYYTVSFRCGNDFDSASVVSPGRVEGLRGWLREHRVSTLNVAGNRESVNPGIGRYAEQFLLCTLAPCQAVAESPRVLRAELEQLCHDVKHQFRNRSRVIEYDKADLLAELEAFLTARGVEVS